jgi:hypothetical protein
MSIFCNKLNFLYPGESRSLRTLSKIDSSSVMGQRLSWLGLVWDQDRKRVMVEIAWQFALVSAPTAGVPSLQIRATRLVFTASYHSTDRSINKIKRSSWTHATVDDMGIDLSIENSCTLSLVMTVFSNFFTEPHFQDWPGDKSVSQPIQIYHF